MLIARNCESWVWPEACRWRMRVNFGWASEANDSCSTKQMIDSERFLQFDQVTIWVYLLDYKYEAIDQANYIHGFVHHMLSRHHNDVVMVHHRHILSKWSSIRRYLDIYRTHIHNLAMRLVLLKLKQRDIKLYKSFCVSRSIQLTIPFSSSTLCTPIIVAVIMHGSFSIK